MLGSISTDDIISSFELTSNAAIALSGSISILDKLILYKNMETSYEIFKSIFDNIQWKSSDQNIVADREIIYKVGKAYKDKIGCTADFYIVEIGSGPCRLYFYTIKI